jgi:predicted permease
MTRQVRALFWRLAGLAAKSRRDREFAEELEANLQEHITDRIRAGMTPEAARRAALVKLGGMEAAKDQYRERRGIPILEHLIRDLRYAIRALRKTPVFTSVALLTLAVCIGANAAIFSAVHAVLLRPLPVRQPDRLVICWGSDPSHNVPVVELSYRNFQDWAAGSRSFSQAAAIGSSTWPAVLDGHGESARLSSAGVSVSFFETLGVVPAVGRGFRPEDDVPQAPRVVVLSHGTWVRRFGADPQAVGTTIQLDEPHTIVGVMPEEFDFPRGTEFWTPVVPVLADSAGVWRTDTLEKVGVLFVIGRLRDGVTPGMATDELDSLADRLEQSGAVRFGSEVIVTPFLDYLFGPVRQALWALFAAVWVLLLIGCANVSGLMLTSVSLRRREHAVRLALGATGRVLAREWLFQTLILSIVGGGLGLIASQWIAQAVVVLAPDDIPRLSDISISLPVVAFSFGAVVTTALLCGAGPIRRAGASNLIEALNDSTHSIPGTQTYQTRSLLLILQMGLSVVLLVAAGLVLRSFVNLRSIDLGFVPSNVVTMTLDPRDHPKPSMNQWMHALLDRVEALPDVRAAGAVFLRPLALGPIGQETAVILEGQPDTPEAARGNPTLNYQVATPGYFPAMRIHLRRGRLFNDQDTATSTPVVLVGETTARRLWPGQNPIGKRILMPTFSPEGSPTRWRTVVGVVNNVRYRGIDDARLDVYDPALQSPVGAMDLVVSSSGDSRRVSAMVQAEARRLDPRVVVDRLTTMDAIVARATAPWRFSVWMFTVFAVIAFVLATVGLFSLVSLDVAERRREFAIRLALGARNADILRPVLLAAGGRALAGVAVGMLAAIVATRGIRTMLFGVEALDVTTYAAVMALILAVVGVASYVPARRATKFDPSIALRGD